MTFCRSLPDGSHECVITGKTYPPEPREPVSVAEGDSVIVKRYEDMGQLRVLKVTPCDDGSGHSFLALEYDGPKHQLLTSTASVLEIEARRHERKEAP